MTNKDYFDKLKKEGLIHKDLDFATLKGEYKKVDAGECSLLAVAMQNPEEHIIVSEDLGNTHYLPSQNIFEEFKAKKGIKIYNYSEWKAINKYTE